MTDYTSYVNVFQGCGEIDLPEPQGVAAGWHFIKGLTGNTHPGACLPFGKYSVCAYSSAYPTGYGINKVNSGEKIRKLFAEMPVIGLSHCHHSGVGAVGVYYNYAVTSAEYGTYSSFEEAFSPKKVLSEDASPGYYAVRMPGILAEATVTQSAAIHHYVFEDAERLAGEGAKISINFANDGLYHEGGLHRQSSGNIRLSAPDEAAADVCLEGVEVHFHVSVIAPAGAKVCASIFDGNEIFCGDSHSFQASDSCGVTFSTDAPDITLCFSYSLRSAEHAAELNASPVPFREARQEARRLWNDALSRIEIDTDDAREREIFYSNLYHSLIKPSDLSGEGFLAGYGDGDFMVDFATMWDIYKTELPLLFTLYGPVSEKILSTMGRLNEILGRYPHCLLMSANTDIEAKQARMLAEFSICDGYYHGIRADYNALLNGAVRDSERFQDFFGRTGQFDGTFYASHILDMTEASRALCGLANALGREDAAAFYAYHAERYKEAFGPDGMMRSDSEYYEGNRYNYSFRPMGDMEGRIALCGEEAFRTACLRFFGFTDTEDISCRFEGFNNETDMETPYVLAQAGLRSELCQVIRDGLDSMFHTGRGGIPGNNDSGGLTSCYIWNVLGLFPMSGYDRMFLSIPRYRSAVLHLHNGCQLRIRKEGSALVPGRITLNGKDTDLVSIRVTDMMAGGELVFWCE